MEKQIMLDTNFLVAPFQMSVSVFDEIENLYPEAEVYTLEDVIQEAKSIEEGKYCDLVEQLIENQEIEVLKTEGSGEVDDLLVELCDEFLVATNDKELKKRIKQRGRPVMIVRGKNYLEVENDEAGKL
ncbi:MAG: PIN domain-containing protein [Candidatus Nanohaloarchaea archaeon]